MRAHTPGEITALLDRRSGGTAEDRERLFAAVQQELRNIVARVMRQILVDNARQVEIVELRYLAGLTEQEVAKAKALSPATIRREIAAARFWLGRRMQGQR